MHRRKFIQIFGAAMVGVNLALFGTGVISSPAKHILPGFNPEDEDHVRYQDSITEERWIGGKEDTYEEWRKVWAKMAHGG